jgi:CDP-6-deoxy-D-xylo-4-hexulose-3-dehydrase
MTFSALPQKNLRDSIINLSREYFKQEFTEKKFIPGESYIPVSGKVLNSDDLAFLIDSSLDLWLTTGRYAAEFEKKFAAWMGVKHCLLCNSGSSANLLAVTALTSPMLGEKRLKPGDEVITVAAGFPTTVNPIFQNNLVPVFVDVKLPTYEIDVSQLEEAYSEKTRAVIIAHTLGNAFDLFAVKAFCDKYDLWLIEDNCDAVGTLYNGKKTGTYGDLATISFYPAHHITMGEGGAVLTNNNKLKKIVESFRDWGRDCWCEPGKDNTCNKRYCWKLGDLPQGYDHKYTYSHVGYNLKVTDMQAAVGCAQLTKLDEFIAIRRNNFDYLYNSLKDLEDIFVLPEATPGAIPSWFGFTLSLREGSNIERNHLVSMLEKSKIGTRLVFAGNLIKQPLYQDRNYRVVGNLEISDFVMNQSFWLGVWPGLTEQMLSHVVTTLKDIVKN